MTFDGTEYSVGDDFNKAGVNERLLFKLYEQFKIDAAIPDKMTVSGAGPLSRPGKVVVEPPPKARKGQFQKRVKSADELAAEAVALEALKAAEAAALLAGEADDSKTDPVAPPKDGDLPPVLSVRNNFGKFEVVNRDVVIETFASQEEADVAIEILMAPATGA
jgi:hypothetical protein